MFSEKKISEFLNQLSSNTPTPGGGTVAALSGGLAASLVSMVASLTVGRKKYQGYDALYEETIGKMKQLSERFQDMMDEDAKAFDGVMKALKMPKKTDDEKQVRKEKLQEAFKNATNSPVNTAEAVVKVSEYAKEMVKNGNKNAVSDAYCAIELCKAAFNMAMENVDINLGSIKDEVYTKKVTVRCEELRETLNRNIKE
ncbi:MAG: cyclodeaminase/cyclohydrolase family protein [Thermotogota bacterium]|nr:cyclodeaminase/cyclohydrolase family protein [Thermotogota bacterium]